MSKFVPNKQHLREALILFFHLKKTAAESHRLLVEAYGEYAPTERTCENWFKRFKSGDFDVKDKERPGQPKKFQDAELEALIKEDPCQTLEELSEALNVDPTTVGKRIHKLGFIQKTGNWVPHELTERQQERRLATCEMLLERHKKKSILYRIVTGDEKWLYYDNPKRRKAIVKPAEPSTSTPKRDIHGKKVMLCIWWDQKGVVYHELLKPNESITAERYRQQIINLNQALQEKRPEWAERHTNVILLHDNARPHNANIVKETLQLLGWEVLAHPPYSPDLAPSDYHLFRAMQSGLSEQHFKNDEEAKNWVDSWIASKDSDFFKRGIHLMPEKWEKVIASDGKYFD